MIRLPLLLSALLLTVGCAHRPAIQPPPAGAISTTEAVRAAQDDPRRGITGTFAVTVQAVGQGDGHIYLNSERDYRHPLNVTVVLDAALRPEVLAAFGQPPELLYNHRLLVRGTARRVRIDFVNDGVPSGKYYYQTQIQVSRIGQLQPAP
ncbi:hypothetical protein [Stenotrophomonas sp. 24(2023)]|uniref:hypothetical protein n=1 Tax=Stenotrophomonas sp. 24(2023) TaxID=3068324 RepID=UPI0027DECFD3|nr:hypothetical protein [Stenotrophomonas sp. 24(2023)]WMJ69882.1 hypothetical protein Q9R17_01870 [Stenotrophomonas sp. 24(2023)]